MHASTSSSAVRPCHPWEVRDPIKGFHPWFGFAIRGKSATLSKVFICGSSVIRRCHPWEVRDPFQ